MSASNKGHISQPGKQQGVLPEIDPTMWKTRFQGAGGQMPTAPAVYKAVPPPVSDLATTIYRPPKEDLAETTIRGMGSREDDEDLKETRYRPTEEDLAVTRVMEGRQSQKPDSGLTQVAGPIMLDKNDTLLAKPYLKYLTQTLFADHLIQQTGRDADRLSGVIAQNSGKHPMYVANAVLAMVSPPFFSVDQVQDNGSSKIRYTLRLPVDCERFQEGMKFEGKTASNSAEQMWGCIASIAGDGADRLDPKHSDQHARNNLVAWQKHALFSAEMCANMNGRNTTKQPETPIPNEVKAHAFGLLSQHYHARGQENHRQFCAYMASYFQTGKGDHLDAAAGALYDLQKNQEVAAIQKSKPVAQIAQVAQTQPIAAASTATADQAKPSLITRIRDFFRSGSKNQPTDKALQEAFKPAPAPRQVPRREDPLRRRQVEFIK